MRVLEELERAYEQISDLQNEVSRLNIVCDDFEDEIEELNQELMTVSLENKSLKFKIIVSDNAYNGSWD